MSSDDLTKESKHLQDLCIAVDSPRSLTIWLLVRNNEWHQLQALDCDPGHYEDISNFADDYLVTKVLSKSPSIPLGIDRANAAYSTYLDAELKNEYTNQRLLSGAHPDWFHSFRKNVAKLLGPLSRTALDQITDRMRNGPGSSFSVGGVGSVLSDKFDLTVDLTANLYPFVRSIMGEQWWSHHRKSFAIVEGNRFTTVPKSSKTDRGICVEPLLNTFVQLGIGSFLKSRLMSYGCNLHSQDKNRDLARRAYRENLATIDLSMASDTMSWGLILEALPSDWIELLDIARCPYSLLPDGEWLELGKWSSMGNGYTFELESLIFYAVCLTIVPLKDRASVSVFGDDIIVPQAYADEVISALEYLGFGVNRHKSFLAGNFYESCGQDFFKGVDVRPYFLKGSTLTSPYEVSIANKLRLYSSKRMAWLGCDPRFRNAWNNLFRASPPLWKTCKVPSTLGDVGFIVSFDEASPPKALYEIEGHVATVYRYSFPNRRKKSFGRLLFALLGLPPSDPNFHSGQPYQCGYTSWSQGREPIKGYLGRGKTRRTIVERWSGGFDWLI